jgi:hypothetical protein
VQIRPPNYGKFSRVERVVIAVPYYKERAYWGFVKAQVGKPYDKLAIVAFAVNRDWRSPDVWFCDELVGAGLEHAEVVRKLAPCVNRLNVRDLYLVVSAIAPVSSPTSRVLAIPSLLGSQPHHRQTKSGLSDPECSLGVSFFDKGPSRNARLPLAVASDEGPGVRVIRPQVHTPWISPMVVGATRDSFHDWRTRFRSRVDRSCVHWNCPNARHANKADSQRPNRDQNGAHRVSSLVCNNTMM